MVRLVRLKDDRNLKFLLYDPPDMFFFNNRVYHKTQRTGGYQLMNTD